MTEIRPPTPGEIPNMLRMYPTTTLLAYVSAQPEGQVMGVTRDENTGKMIAHCILPTKQRVMLGLGIGDDNANAHHKYRQLYPNGYELVWIDHPDTDERTEKLARILKGRATTRRAVHQAIKEPSNAPHPTPSPSEHVGSLVPVGELTAELVRAGAREARKDEQPVDTSSRPAPTGDSEPDPKPQDKDASLGGFF